ncbi:MAG TPA: alpha-amylase family glycosyl hydrolase [Gemmatimonadales bacterium]|nr:alpha-amylase family glycosyl hydrolase [Gemmatimonadales bacterium]
MRQKAHHRAALAALFSLAAVALQPAPARAQAPAALAPDTSWVTRSALYEVFVRDFSPEGTLRGVTAGLGRIQATGADVIWLMPLNPVGVAERKGPVGSPYAARDYDALDPALGTPADLRALVRAAHARGMKVILDWVPDHTSPDNVWVKEHPDFYYRDSAGHPLVPRDLQGHFTDWTDVVQLDYHNPAMRAAMIAELRRWLVTYDLDGFRQDVAHFIPLDFWSEANTTLRAAVHRPLMMLAEAGGLEMHRAGFDLTYGWDGYGRLKGVWRGAPADSFVIGVMADQQAMPAGGMRMRFTTDHDETAWDRPPVILFGGSEGARAAFVAMALMPGRPLLYNGQEVESPQKDSIFTREPIVWSQPHAAEARAWYARVVHLARTDPAFLRGELHRVAGSDSADVIAYARGDALVLANVRSHGARFTVTGFDVAGTRDLLTGRAQRGDTLALPAYGVMVLKR